MPVEVSRAAAVAPRRDDGSLAGHGERVEHPLVGIETFVGDQHLGLHAGEQVIGAHQVVRLASGQKEPERVAERVGQGMLVWTAPGGIDCARMRS